MKVKKLLSMALALSMVLSMVLSYLPMAAFAGEAEPTKLEYQFNYKTAGVASTKPITVGSGVSGTTMDWSFVGYPNFNGSNCLEQGIRFGLKGTDSNFNSANTGVVMKISVPVAGDYIPTIAYGAIDSGMKMKVYLLKASDAASGATDKQLVSAYGSDYIVLKDEIDTYDSEVANNKENQFTKISTVDGNAVNLAQGEYYVIFKPTGKNEAAKPYYTAGDVDYYYMCLSSLTLTERTAAIMLTADAEINKGETTQLTAVVTDKNGNVVQTPVSYTSSDTAVATVNASGMVTGVGGGTVTITAEATVNGERVRKTVNMKIVQPDTVTALKLSSSAMQLTKPGKTAQLMATAVWSNSGDMPMTPLALSYASSDPAVATVDENGVVTAVAEGTVTITATVKETQVSGSVELEVLGAPVFNGEFYEYIFTCDALGLTERYNRGFYSLAQGTDGWITKDMIQKGQPWATETTDPKTTSAPMLTPSEYFQLMARFVSGETTAPILNNHVITVSLQVDEPGTYMPTVTITAGPNHPIAKYYMVKKTGQEDLTTQAKADAWVRSIGEEYYIGQIDCYSTVEELREVSLTAVTLEAGDYMFLIKFDGGNEAYKPADSNGYLVKYWMNTITLDSSPAQSVSVRASSRTIRAGVSTSQLTTRITLESGKTHELYDVIYESMDPGIAVVSADGVVSGVTPGKATIKAMYETYDGYVEDEIVITVRGDLAPSGEQYSYVFNRNSAGAAADVELLSKLGTAMSANSAPWAFEAALNPQSALLTADRLVWDGSAMALSITVDKGGMYVPTATVGVGPNFGKVEYYLRPITGNENLPENTEHYIHSFLEGELIAVVDCYADAAGTKTVQLPRQQLEAGTYMLLIKSADEEPFRYELLDMTLDGTAPQSLAIKVEPGTIVPGESTAEVTVTMTHESGRTYAAENITLESLNGSVASVDKYGTVTGLTFGPATIKATYSSPTLVLTAEATVNVDGDPVYQYIFSPASLGEKDRVTSANLWNRVADQNGSAPWQFYGARYGNNYQLKTDDSLYFNARSSATPGVPSAGTGYVLLLEVGKDGAFIPSITVGVDQDRQIARYYLKKKGEIDLSGASANLTKFISENCTAEDLLCEIDCYSAAAGTKTVVLPERTLEQGQYYLIVELVGMNEAVTPMASGDRYFVVNDIRSFGLDGTKLEELAVEADTVLIDLKGEAAQISPLAKYESGISYSVEGAVYQSLNPDIAAVDANGVVTGLAVGTAAIKVTVSGVGESTLKFTVVEDVSVPQKDGRTYYTDSIIEAARQNILTYAWAEQDRDQAVENASKYINRIDQIYDLIPSAGIPRACDIILRNQADRYVCPRCGMNLYTKYKNYPWVVNALLNPWKIACPECDSQFPSNDFASFYELGLNERGEFDRVRALEAHRQMLIDMGLGDQLSDVKPADYTDEHYWTALPEGWYEYYGYGVEGGYLYNELYPNIATDTKNDGTPVLKEYETAARWGVDDGWGYGTGQANEANKEERFSYIAYYAHWAVWSQNSEGGKALVSHALTSLIDAYLYTGDERYGRAGAIILDRIADFYPYYDSSAWSSTYENSNGGTSSGHILGQIWEACLVQTFAKAYDAFWPAYEDPEVIAYLTEKAIAQGYTDKLVEVDGALTVTAATLRLNIENNLIREIRDVIMEGRAVGNFGMAQTAMTLAAIVLDSHPETDEMLDWVFRDGEINYTVSYDGGSVNSKLLADLSRDGFGTESSGSYNIIWLEQLADVAEAFSRYDEYSGVNLAEHPKFVAMVQNWKDFTLVRRGIPGVGDGGIAAGYTKLPGNVMNLLTIYNQLKKSDDPTQQALAIEFAQHIYWLCGNNVNNIPYETFSEHPAATSAEIQRIIDKYGQWDFDKNTLLSGYGFASLRSGTLTEIDEDDKDATQTIIDTQRDVWMYFGGAVSHLNSDNLHIGMDAFGVPITSDHGYPEGTGQDANRYQWLQSTIAHNTVTVDNSVSIKGAEPQKPLYFDSTGTRVNVMDVDGSESYTQTEEYRRTVVMIDYDDENSYTVDFFKILGGDDHLYSFHVDSNIDATYSDNLTFIQQEGGSYASPDVEQGKDPWTKAASSYETMYPRGYTWLGDVKRNDDPGTGNFWVDYEIIDARSYTRNEEKMDIHLRLTAVNDWEADEVTLAQGWPPRKSGTINLLSHMEYVLIRRSGDQLNTLFTTVLEPYNAERYIKSITGVKIEAVSGARPGENDLAKAVKVELMDGRIDYVLYAQNSNVIYRVTDEATGYSIMFNGTVGVWTVMQNENGGYDNVYSYVCNGSILGEAGSEQQGLNAALTGRVIGFTGCDDNAGALSMNSYIDVAFDHVTVPAEAEFAAFAQSLVGRIFVGEYAGEGNAVYHIRDVERLGDTSVRLWIGNISLINGYTEDGIYTFDVEKNQHFAIPMSYVVCSHNYTNACDGTCNSCEYVRIPAEHVGGTATCEHKAVCTVCNEAYGERAEHELTKIEAKLAGGMEPGNITYHSCSSCNRLYRDNVELTEILASQTVIPQLIRIANGKARVPETAVDRAIEAYGKNVVLDMKLKDDTAKPVSQVVLPVASLEKIAALGEDATLTVVLNEVTFFFDAAVLKALAAQAEDTSIPLNLQTELNEVQQQALEGREVVAVMSVEIMTSQRGSDQITDLGGGTALVKFPAAAEGAKYKLLRVAEDGTVEEVEGADADGYLTDALTHTYHYVLVKTGGGFPVIPVVLAGVGLAALAAVAVVLLRKKRKAVEPKNPVDESDT